MSTAVRLLASLGIEPFVDRVGELLEASGLCGRFRDIGVDVCKCEGGRARDKEIVENLVKVLDMCGQGEIPVTEELVSLNAGASSNSVARAAT
ncbi:MAG: hypothetical protein ACO2OR_02130 [Desulfurococcaceae archaeon]